MAGSHPGVQWNACPMALCNLLMLSNLLQKTTNPLLKSILLTKGDYNKGECWASSSRLTFGKWKVSRRKVKIVARHAFSFFGLRGGMGGSYFVPPPSSSVCFFFFSSLSSLFKDRLLQQAAPNTLKCFKKKWQRRKKSIWYIKRHTWWTETKRKGIKTHCFTLACTYSSCTGQWVMILRTITAFI